MIVVVGSPVALVVNERAEMAGLASWIAAAAATAGAAVQLVGRVGEDEAGDRILLDLAAAGVSHVAVLREPGRPTPVVPATRPRDRDADPTPIDVLADEEAEFADDPVDGRAPAGPAGLSIDAGDLQLALRYVPDYRVLIVAAVLDAPALRAVVAAADWSGAQLVVVLPANDAAPPELPDRAVVFQEPGSDSEGAFASMVGAFAVALDRGDEPQAAFVTAQRTGGWSAVAD